MDEFSADGLVGESALVDAVAARLRATGSVAADDEAAEIVDVAGGDRERVETMVVARSGGLPLAWVTGRTRFCGRTLRVDRGVYVPRWQSESVAVAACRLLPDHGRAVDLCCGSGAIAAVLAAWRPRAEVIGVDIDPAAVDCATANGVRASVGDLFGPLPSSMRGALDLVVAVAPYLPSHLTAGSGGNRVGGVAGFASSAEPVAALDGGSDGLDVVRRIVAESPSWLRAGGHVALEVGSPQVREVRLRLAAAGFDEPVIVRDGDGDVSGVVARLKGPDSRFGGSGP